ncbi:prepilin-type N-terminal cleavage/methylation domain-containing protein [bacterium]|nr:MAG: prepilin-type N-terminal cleavage/methylation domain-containing protein [bacterium]
MATRTGRRRGITLIELLVSVVILGVTAPGLLLASGTSVRLGMTAQKRATAQALAVQQLELFRSQCRTSTLSSGSATTSYAALKLGSFTIRRDVTLSGNAGTCEVLVSWSDTRGNGVFTDSLQLGTAGRLGQ